MPTDQHAAEIEARIASGDCASVSEGVRAALRQFLARFTVPHAAQVDRDIAKYPAERGRRRIRSFRSIRTFGCRRQATVLAEVAEDKLRVIRLYFTGQDWSA